MKKDYFIIAGLVVVIIATVAFMGVWYIGSVADSNQAIITIDSNQSEVVSNIDDELLALNTLEQGYGEGDINGDQVAAVAIPGSSGTYADTHNGATPKPLAPCTQVQGLMEAQNVYYSMLFPDPVPTVTTNCNVYLTIFRRPPTGGVYQNGTSYGFQGSNVCKRPIAISIAKSIVEDLAKNGIDASSMISKSRLYADWDSSFLNYTILSAFNSKVLSGRMGGPHVGYCLDAGYVSNYPNAVKNFLTFFRAHPNTIVFYGSKGANTSSSVLANFLSGRGYSQSSIGGEVIDPSIVYEIAGSLLTVPTAAGNSNTYTVSVDYNHFTAEAAKGGYTSVYTSSGTKTVSVTVFTFSDVTSMTASAAIARLATLGYRGATLDELYAAKSQIGTSVVGLGTTLGSLYGYPISSGSSTVGMGLSRGPFNTNLYRFAAVRN